MIRATTFYANIFVGLRNGYSDELCHIQTVEDVCQQFANDVGLCITVTSTRFIYKDGNEEGVIVGLINYPRFPKAADDIKSKALNLAVILKTVCKQQRVSVLFPDETVMIGEV